MASPRLMISTEQRGATGGLEFDDSSIIGDITNAVVTRIVVGYWKDYIRSLTMHYAGGHSQVTRGEKHDSSQSEIVLGPGEFITKIEGVLDVAIVSKLTFTTNTGVIFGPYGEGHAKSTRGTFVWNASDNAPVEVAPRMGLLYFSGRESDNFIHKLGATFAPYPDVSDTPALDPGRAMPYCNVKFEPQVIIQLTSGALAVSSFARDSMSPCVSLHVGVDAVVFYAQETTLCRLPFFRAALQGGFREAVQKEIKMPEDDPVIFTTLLEHLSTGSYTYPYNPLTIITDLPEGCFHVSVYNVAFKYDWQPLVDDAVANFLLVLSKLTGMDIIRLWKAGYESGLTVPVCEREGRLVNFKLQLPGLLQLLYETDAEEMEGIVSGCPALANDFMRLLVARPVT